MLQGTYYNIVRAREDGLSADYRLRLLADCDVYRGHFPGRVVCPGAFHIETIRELASRLAGRWLSVKAIKSCRLTAVATPDGTPELDLNIETTPTDDALTVVAHLSAGGKVIADFKGTMI